MTEKPVKFSILDLSPVLEGGDVKQALDRSVLLAQTGERLGYERFWMAEHHGMKGIASAATAVALAHVGAAQKPSVSERAELCCQIMLQ